MSEVKQKPSICKKSESILSQAKMREFSAAKIKHTGPAASPATCFQSLTPRVTDINLETLQNSNPQTEQTSINSNRQNLDIKIINSILDCPPNNKENQRHLNIPFKLKHQIEGKTLIERQGQRSTTDTYFRKQLRQQPVLQQKPKTKSPAPIPQEKMTKFVEKVHT